MLIVTDKFELYGTRPRSGNWLRLYTIHSQIVGVVGGVKTVLFSSESYGDDHMAGEVLGEVSLGTS